QIYPLSLHDALPILGGSGEYCLDGVNCLRVPPGDPAALAHAARQLVQSRDLCQRLVEGGLRTASTCTLDHQAAGIERSLLGASRSEEHTSELQSLTN